MRKFLFIVGVLSAGLASALGVGDELLVNGNFETGSKDPWKGGGICDNL